MSYFQRMLKMGNSMKIELEAPRLLREALADVPGVERVDITTPAESEGLSADLLCRLRFHGREHVLMGEVKSNGQPRHVQTALFQLKRQAQAQTKDVVPLIFAPYLSEDARALCVEGEVGYFDLQGNARIAFPGFFLSRTMAGKPVAERRELRSLFKPKSAAVLRRMLREPSRPWRVVELATEAGVSVGHVSNVRGSLLDRGWAELADDGIFLTQPDGLLDAWRDEYAPPAGELLSRYTTLHGAGLDEALKRRANELPAGGFALLSAFSAARWMAPYARVGVHSFYADRQGADWLARAMGLVAAGRGANVEIRVVEDMDLLRDAIEPAPGIRCTSVVQTYLDLHAAGERGREAAEHLRQEKLQWRK